MFGIFLHCSKLYSAVRTWIWRSYNLQQPIQCNSFRYCLTIDSSPSDSKALPLTLVPLELPISNSLQACPVHSSLPCFSDTEGSRTQILLALVLPILNTEPGLVYSVPALGPSKQASLRMSGMCLWSSCTKHFWRLQHAFLLTEWICQL